MLIKGDLSKLSCIVYVRWRLFSQAAKASIRRAKNSSDRHDHIHNAGAERKAHDNNVPYHHTRNAGGRVITHVIQYFTSSALLLLCLLQCVKGNYYLKVGLVNQFFCQKKRAVITPFLKNGLLTGDENGLTTVFFW